MSKQRWVQSGRGPWATGLLVLMLTSGMAWRAIASAPAATKAPVPFLSTTPQPLPAVGGVAADPSLWNAAQPGQRRALLTAIRNSLRYLATNKAAQAYQTYPVPGITRDRVRRSLERFQQLLLGSRTAAEFQAAIRREFIWFQAAGKDGKGTVGFTGYFEPTYVASPVPTAEFRYPLFRRPPDLERWPNPAPTRLELEGADGLAFSKGRLRGLELVWLRDRMEAFLVQVQGSARLQLTNGRTMTIGYAGHTNYPYTSIGRELVEAGKFSLSELNLPTLIRYFQDNPADLNDYLPRNRRFVFFKETGGQPAKGSLGVPVIPERSIATDRTLFPPGALALIQTQLPYSTPAGHLEPQAVTRYVLNQDTGGAIIGPGRVDVFMGTGQHASDRAGLVNATGQLYYLLLKR